MVDIKLTYGKDNGTAGNGHSNSANHSKYRRQRLRQRQRGLTGLGGSNLPRSTIQSLLSADFKESLEIRPLAAAATIAAATGRAMRIDLLR